MPDGLIPLRGHRFRPVGDTCGWYIWAGHEHSSAPDFYLPVHLAHVVDWRPEVAPYLDLPPGWNFVIAPGYEDVWYDPACDRE